MKNKRVATTRPETSGAEPVEVRNLPFSDTVTRILTITSITLGNVAILGGVGYYLDLKLGTKPWILIGALVLAYIVTQIMIYRRVKAMYVKSREGNQEFPSRRS